MARARGRGLVLAALLAGAALTGCTDGEAGQGDHDAPLTQQTAETEESAPEGGTDEPAPEDGASDGAPDGAELSLTVEVDGDGPFGLSASEAPDVDARDYSGKLIIGPGSCFAITDDAQPQLVVFADGAEFVLRDDRPSVTTSGLGTVLVGDDFDFTAVEIAADDVDGIPERCLQGAQEAVLVVEG